MMRTKDFLHSIDANAARVRRYALGGDGSEGGCDCIGLIIGAVRLAGEKWPGVHGSNYAARYCTKRLRRVSGAAELSAGMLVFKGRAPSDSGYALPAAYQKSEDLTDSYPVGVVTGVSPLSILHCTGVPGGIRRDSALGAWRYAGKLSLIDEETGDDPSMSSLYRAVVTAENGYPVKMREQPSRKAAVLASVPIGTRLDVSEEAGDWARVSFQGATGYMMLSFLSPCEESAPSALHQAKDALEKALSLLQIAILEAEK